MGNMEGVKDDILNISETKAKYFDAKGILVATFTSVAEPAELKDFFNSNGRSFFLFDLGTDVSSYHLDNEILNIHLFGYLTDQGDKLKAMSEKLMDDLSASTKDKKIIKQQKPLSKVKSIPKIHYSEMSKNERDNLVNTIIDKYTEVGIEKISSSDKNILNKISELK